MAFGCCSSWVDCPVFGYCPRYSYRTKQDGSIYMDPSTGKAILEYRGYKEVFQCALGQRLFIQKDPQTQAIWQESALKARDKMRAKGWIPNEINESEKKLFWDTLTATKSGSPAPTISIGSAWEHIVAGIKVRGDEVWMPAQKVIDTKKGLMLVSWLYKDIVQYAIMDEDGGTLEVFKPTPSLKGNALRAYVIQQFKLREVNQYLGKWTVVAMDVADINLGDVIAYERGKGKIMFAKVVHITPALIFAITPTGEDTLWIKDKVNAKIEQQEIYVISQDEVPETFKTWPKSKYE